MPERIGSHHVLTKLCQVNHTRWHNGLAISVPEPNGPEFTAECQMCCFARGGLPPGGARASFYFSLFCSWGVCGGSRLGLPPFFCSSWDFGTPSVLFVPNFCFRPRGEFWSEFWSEFCFFMGGGRDLFSSWGPLPLKAGVRIQCTEYSVQLNIQLNNCFPRSFPAEYSAE